MSKILPVLFALYPILFSGISLFWQYSSRNRSRPVWAFRILTSGSIIAFAFLAGPWAFTSYYLRYLLPGIFAVTVFFSFPKGKRSRLRNCISETILSGIIFLFFTVMNIIAVLSPCSFADTVNITFPFRTGVFYILQGGYNMVTNPFHTLSGSKQAIDIVKLNSFGNRADGIAPADLNSYSTFGEELCSPCKGVIFEACDSLPDNRPGKPDISYSKGNYILLNCRGIQILMAHLKQGSLRVKPGEVVETGQPLAEIGNSGNTLEPHLHIYGTREGKGSRLTFDGRSLSINSVIVRK